MSLHDVKIRSKLTLTIAIFIVLMVFSSGLSLLSLSRANAGIQIIVNNDYPTTVKANDLIDSFQEFVNTQQLMLLDEAGTFRQNSEKHLAGISAHITALLAEMNKSSTDAASQRALEELADIRKQYLDSRYRILQAVQQNDRPAALQEMMSTAIQVQEKYKDKVQELIAIQNQKMTAAGELVDKNYRSNRLVTILLTLLSIVLGSFIAMFVVCSITRPLGHAVAFAGAIAEGDLTGSITVTRKDETAASMEQITSTVKNTFDHTNEATKLSSETAAVVKDNGQMMSQVTSKMRVINETSNRMSDIINLIDSIAFQTNIPAVNAAVEAARAWEHGRGCRGSSPAGAKKCLIGK